MARNKRQCKARNKQGEPCGAPATEGGLCFFHANPNKASELGRTGGQKNRHAAAEALSQLPALDSAAAVDEALTQTIVDLRAGRIDPKKASALGTLLDLKRRALETSDLARRIAEFKSGENGGEGGPSPVN